MTDLSLVDAELRPMLSMLPALVLNDETLPLIRGFSSQRASSRNDRVNHQEHWIEGVDGSPRVRVIVVKPSDMVEPAAGILEIHGGGFVSGSPDIDMPIYEEKVLALGCAIVAVDYRLAPETRHPGPLNDCYAALRWMHGEASTLGINVRRIGVSGSSAGAGLAVSLALYVRSLGERLIAFQQLLAPMLDDRTCVKLLGPYVGQHIWTPANNRFGWTALLGHEPGLEKVADFVAPGRETDLSDLPPTFLAVGALDLFLRENLEFVSGLSQAGVPVEAHVYPGAFHGFTMAQTASVVAQAKRDAFAALARFCVPRHADPLDVRVAS